MDDPMTIYGLGFRYACPGYFINKIFEYGSENMPGFPVDGKEADGTYIFIGDIADMQSLPYDTRDTIITS